jgi:hypothetical protein
MDLHRPAAGVNIHIAEWLGVVERVRRVLQVQEDFSQFLKFMSRNNQRDVNEKACVETIEKTPIRLSQSPE